MIIIIIMLEIKGQRILCIPVTALMHVTSFWLIVRTNFFSLSDLVWFVILLDLSRYPSFLFKGI